jgi:hypothetical protein
MLTVNSLRIKIQTVNYHFTLLKIKSGDGVNSLYKIRPKALIS